jgi:alpha-1,3-mannosyltransferase
MDKFEYDIVIVVRVFHPSVGGMEHYTYELANRLGTRGKKVLVITSNRLNDGTSVVRSSYSNFQVLTVPSLCFGGYILPYTLKAWGIRSKIVHVFGMDPFVDAVRMQLKFEYLKLSPLGGFFHTQRHAKLKKLYGRIISKNLYRQAKCFSISPADDNIINNFLEFDSAYAGSGIHVRAQASGSDVLVMGRISDNKRLDKCLEYGLSRFPHRKIYVIGEGTTRYSLPKSPNIVFLGYVSDDELSAIINKCGYFISLSEFESLGLTAVEALRAGLFCILSPIESYKFIYSSIKNSGVFPNIFFHDEGVVAPSKLPVSHNIEEHRKAIDDLWSWDSVIQRLYKNDF